MDAFVIEGGATLRGAIKISGSKNASLPTLAAAVLAPGTSVLKRAPDLADVRTMSALLTQLGAKVARDDDALHIDATDVDSHQAPYDLVRTMRASILVLGPLLARLGRARVSMPGGCAIGARPIDQHLKGLVALGAHIRLEHGYVVAEAPHGLRGGHFTFAMPTVTGTENLMLAAALIDSEVVLNNAACEPEIMCLARALKSMGVAIEGAGSHVIRMHGKKKLSPYVHEVNADRIECGTFLVAGALAADDLQLTHAQPEQQTALIDTLMAMGVDIKVDGTTIHVGRPSTLAPVDVVTAPYPGFPTDMQAQLMSLMSMCPGTSTITETIWENRFMHVAELDRLGANIRVRGAQASIVGVKALSGSIVMATDLRASACLVLAGLVAEGTTKIRRIYHLDRGYEQLESKLSRVGANIRREHDA